MKNLKKYAAAVLVGATLASAPTLVLAEQSEPVKAFDFEQITLSIQDVELDLVSFKSMVENFVTEVVSHEADVRRIREEYFGEKNFAFNTQELAKNVCSLVYIANYSHFPDEVKAQILGTYVPNDTMEIMVNMLSVTNIINSYNQVMLRDQEEFVDLNPQTLAWNGANMPTISKDSLISYAPAFGVEKERNEYEYALETLVNSVNTGRVYDQNGQTRANGSFFTEEFETLYNYFGKLLGGGGAHNIEYAEFGAQTIINQTVGMDFLESIKVVMDAQMQAGMNATVESRMQKNVLQEVDEMQNMDKNVWNRYFEDTLAFIPREDAKEKLLSTLGLVNRYGQALNTLGENISIAPQSIIDWEKTPEALIYRYIHVYDEINSLDNIMKALGYDCTEASKTR